MSSAGSRQPPSQPPLVQQLLAERRELMVEVERLRLRTAEMVADPRVGQLQAEVARLRALLEQAREERDRLLQGVRQAVDRLIEAGAGSD